MEDLSQRQQSTIGFLFGYKFSQKFSQDYFLPQNIHFMLLLIVFTAGSKVLFSILKKEFKLYFAKGCFEIVSKSTNAIEKLKYIIRGLDNYDAYLQRRLGLGINNLEKIYSKITSILDIHKDQSIELLSKSFESDPLAPVRYLSEFMFVPNIEILIIRRRNRRYYLTAIGSFLATSVPIVISLLQLVSQHVGIK
jgi:hypothetical protein